MKKSVVRLGAVAALAVAALAPSAAFADDFGYYEVNYGNGICATVSCGAYGCSVIDYHYCPNEVSGG
jgi:hypothetical protein